MSWESSTVFKRIRKFWMFRIHLNNDCFFFFNFLVGHETLRRQAKKQKGINKEKENCRCTRSCRQRGRQRGKNINGTGHETPATYNTQNIISGFIHK